MGDQGAGGDRLPGEDLDSAELDDVGHWIRVYEELIGTLADLVGQEERHQAPAQRLEQVRSQHRQAIDRLRFWQRRLAEVQRGTGDVLP